MIFSPTEAHIVSQYGGILCEKKFISTFSAKQNMFVILYAEMNDALDQLYNVNSLVQNIKPKVVNQSFGSEDVENNYS